MELPPYRVPHLRQTLHRMFESGREFVLRAGTVIFAMSIVIWALLYFPRPESIEQDILSQQHVSPEAAAHAVDAAYLEQSYLGRFGQFVQPVFAPAGYDWKITVGVLASFPARELIISTLGITYALGGEVDEASDDLRTVLSNTRWESGPRTGQPVFNLPVALSVMVFFALCMQCGATVAVIAQELNWRWAVGSFLALTALAWIAAVAVYQAGILLA